MRNRSFSAEFVVGSTKGNEMKEGGSLTVLAGAFDRRETVVEMPIGGKVPAQGLQLRDDAGGVTALQFLPDSRAVFHLKVLKAGDSRKYRLERGQEAGQAVRATHDGGAIRVSVDAKDAFTYQGAKTQPPPGADPALARGGYIHPIRTPGGTLISDEYAPSHPHHHGIWSPWTQSEFEGRTMDFWNMMQKTATVEVEDFGGTFSGTVCGGLRAVHRFVDLMAPGAPKTALIETWDIIAYNVNAPCFLFDLTIHQECAGSSPLKLKKYPYGGLGFRGHREWDGEENTFFLTSEGKTRANGHETRARWCHVGGKVDGKLAGIAILDHPSNFRAPQPMRIHPCNPFFCYAPVQLGELTIEPGKPYDARYRFVTSDGPPDANQIDRLWNDFAHPPEVIYH